MKVGGDVNKKVSVIVPIYNTRKYLEKCLESIRNQTYQDIEVIMINDGSKDGSEIIAHEYELKDDRFWLFSQENAGVSIARNHGIDLATGAYILFVDSDDWIETNMIETLVMNIEQKLADVACCQYDRIKTNNIGDLEVWNQDKAIETFIIHKQINGSIVNKLFCRKAIADIRLEPSIKYGEDALFFWKILQNIKLLTITNKVLYHVTLHDDSASGGGSYKEIRRDCVKVWETIADCAAEISAKHGAMAKAQLANMSFFSIYEMSYYGYRNEDDESCFLNTLKTNFKELKNAVFIPKREKIAARIMITNIEIIRILILIRAKLSS